MFLFFLPSKETQKVQWSDLLIASLVAHTIGLVVGSAINVVLGRIIGIEDGFTAAFVVQLWLWPNITLFPMTFALGYLCSRIGLLGFGASLGVGAIIGIATANYMNVYFAADRWHVGLGDVWLGLCYGLPSSSLYWLALRVRRPEAFEHDPIARSWNGLLLYITLMIITIAAPFTPQIIKNIQLHHYDRTALGRFEGRLRDQLWTKAVKSGQQKFKAFENQLTVAKNAMVRESRRLDASVSLGRQLQKWGLIDKAREEYVTAAKIAGYPWQRDPCAPLERVLSQQLEGGDYVGTHLTCLRGKEQYITDCFRCLASTTDGKLHILNHRELPFAFKEELVRIRFQDYLMPGEPLREWRYGQLLPKHLVNSYKSGGIDAVRKELTSIPRGAVRADAFVDMGKLLIERGSHEDAIAIFLVALEELRGDPTDAVIKLTEDSLLSRICEAWISAGELAEARKVALQLSDTGLRERLLLRVDNP